MFEQPGLAPFLESYGNISDPESYFMLAEFAFKI